MHGIYDDTWTAVDQGANADCVTGSYSNTADANGKVGCLFGIAADTPLFGRFTASSFAVLNQTVTPACAAPGKIPFTYMGQSFANVSLTIQALNGAGQKLANYDSSLLSSLASISWSAENANDGSNLSSRLAVPPPAKIWLNGQYVVNSTGATFARATGPDGSFASLQLGVSVTDPDGANLSGLDMNPNTAGTCSGNNCTAKAVGTPLAVRYGRLAVQSAFGWEKFRIPVNVQAQYWNGVDFVQNPDDSCTVFSPVNFSLSSFQGLLPCETSITLNNGGQLSAGNGQIVFQAPGKTGSLLISPELGVVATGITCIGLLPVSSSPATAAAKTWLQGRWSGNANYSNNPKATVRFGISRGADKVIDTREVY
jgi:MSHA biogenesis protein MshQ